MKNKILTLLIPLCVVLFLLLKYALEKLFRKYRMFLTEDDAMELSFICLMSIAIIYVIGYATAKAEEHKFLAFEIIINTTIASILSVIISICYLLSQFLLKFL